MQDTKRRMTDSQEPYTNMDLDTAEELLIQAGKPELAVALRYQAQGVRNLVQGEWGKSFIKSLDDLLAVHIRPIPSAIVDLRTEVATRLKKLEAGQRLYNKKLKAQDERHEGQIKDIIGRLDHKRTELDQIQRELAELKAWKQAQERGGDVE
jgi:hypothetical protein